MKALMSALAGIFLAIFLTGCSERIVYRDVYKLPSKEWSQPTQYGSFRELGLKSYEELIVVYVPYLKAAVGSCNVDKGSTLEYILKAESEQEEK